MKPSKLYEALPFRDATTASQPIRPSGSRTGSRRLVQVGCEGSDPSRDHRLPALQAGPASHVRHDLRRQRLYKQHHGDVLKRGIPNQALFEAYVQYCFAPKHTVGEQLLNVRRDKRERAAYAAAVGDEMSGDEEEEEGDEDDQDDDQRYGVAMAESGDPAGEAGIRDE
jgi:hypothetical protein